MASHIKMINIGSNEELKSMKMPFVKNLGLFFDFDGQLNAKNLNLGDSFSGLISLPGESPIRYEGELIMLVKYGNKKGYGVHLKLPQHQNKLEKKGA